MSFKKGKNEIAEVLRNVQGYHKGEGTFWVPQAAYTDLGFLLGAKINPAHSKIFEFESKSTKHKNDNRIRSYTKKTIS
jgi:hypothetical protein